MTTFLEGWDMTGHRYWDKTLGLQWWLVSPSKWCRLQRSNHTFHMLLSERNNATAIVLRIMIFSFLVGDSRIRFIHLSQVILDLFSCENRYCLSKTRLGQFTLVGSLRLGMSRYGYGAIRYVLRYRYHDTIRITIHILSSNIWNVELCHLGSYKNIL